MPFAKGPASPENTPRVRTKALEPQAKLLHRAITLALESPYFPEHGECDKAWFVAWFAALYLDGPARYEAKLLAQLTTGERALFDMTPPSAGLN